MPFMLVLLAINAYAALVGIVVIAVLMKLQKQNEKHLEARLQALRLAQIRSLAAMIDDPQLRDKLFAEIAHVENEVKHESGV